MSNCKISWNNKFGTKSAIFGYFWARILKTYCHIWNQQPQICLFAKFHEKMPKFGTQNAWFGYLWPKMPYLDIFELQFKKNNCHIWISNPWICLIAKYWEIMKMPKSGTISALFGYFRARILKNCCHVWNQHPRTRAIAKFCEETKMPKFGTKNAFIGYFWPEMPYLCIFRQELKKSYCQIWNQHPQISLFAKFHEKTKMSNFGTKNALFGYFWDRINYLEKTIRKKTVVIFEISPLKFIKSES